MEIKNKKLVPIDFKLNYLYKSKDWAIFKRKKEVPKHFFEKFEISTEKFIGCYLYETDDVDILIIPRVEKNTIISYEWYWHNSKNEIYKSKVNIDDLEIVFKEISDWHDEFYDYQTFDEFFKENYQEYLLISGQEKKCF